MAKKEKIIPKFESPIFETHCHLDYLEEDELQATLDKSKEYGVDRIITIAVSPDNLEKVITIAEAHTEIYFTLGIHPHESKDYNTDVKNKIIELSAHKKNVAIGEIGLDYHYDFSPRTKQLDAFCSQLDIAKSLNKPVVIHTREADQDTGKILEEYKGITGVVHSFTSSIELAQQAIDMGLYIGFNGIITFNSAQNVRDVLEITPLSQILLETDAPYLTPTPFRGQKNAPYYLPIIAQKVAEVKGLETEEVIKTCYKNSMDLFF